MDTKQEIVTEECAKAAEQAATEAATKAFVQPIILCPLHDLPMYGNAVGH